MRFEVHRPVRLMEICGTHTMAIAKAGLKQLLPGEVRLISGPGCPVCVTPAGALDGVLALSMEPNVTIASYGDLLRVPGSVRGDCLNARRAMGADVRVVYSPVDAVELAKAMPHREVVFLGVGFETTAPGTAAAILMAREEGVENFSVLSLLKYTLPAVRALMEDPECAVDGLLCPGHVATILGAEAFRFLVDDYGKSAVVGGFETGDVVKAVELLVDLADEGRAELVNAYTRGVRPQGNPAARAAMDRVFAPKDDIWRGLGMIPQSGMAIRPEFAAQDAAVKFSFTPGDKEPPTPCRCGEVLRGVLEPRQCPLFGAVCTPADPVGPCMVSGEGSCAAAYKYHL